MTITQTTASVTAEPPDGSPLDIFSALESEVRSYCRSWPVVFDTAQAGDVLGRNGLRCPRFAEYVGAMVRFYSAHEHDDAYRPAHER